MNRRANKFKRLLFISVLLMTLTPAANAITKTTSNCGPVNTGGRLLHLENHLLFQNADMEEPSAIPMTSVSMKGPIPNHSYLGEIPEEETVSIYRISGVPAALILKKLLKIHENDNEYLNCRLKVSPMFGFQVLYADGITCRNGFTLNQGDYFSCTMVVYGKNNEFSASTFIALPRPAMGAGNTSSVIDIFNNDFFSSDFLLEQNKFMLEFEKNPLILDSKVPDNFFKEPNWKDIAESLKKKH